MSTVTITFDFASSNTRTFRSLYADGGVGQGIVSEAGPGQFGPMVTDPSSVPCGRSTESSGDVGLELLLHAASENSAKRTKARTPTFYVEVATNPISSPSRTDSPRNP